MSTPLPTYDSRSKEGAIKRLYVVTVCCDFLVWSTSAKEASDFLLSLPMDLVEPNDWYAITKLSRNPIPDLKGETSYDTLGFFPTIPVLVTDDADVDLDLTVERAIELDRLAHALTGA
jgi:hypothetical protein